MAAIAIGNQYIRSKKIKDFKLLLKELDCYKDSKGLLFDNLKEAIRIKDEEIQRLIAVVDCDLQNRSLEIRSTGQTNFTQTSMILSELNISDFFSKASVLAEDQASLTTRAQGLDSTQSNPITLGKKKPNSDIDLRFVSKDLINFEPNKELSTILMQHCNVICFSLRSSVCTAPTQVKTVKLPKGPLEIS